MREAGTGIVERDFARKGLTAAEIGELVDAAGGVAKILSTRTAGAKARGWTAEAPPDRATYVAAAAEDNNLVRRPALLVRRDGRTVVIVGGDLEAMRSALG